MPNLPRVRCRTVNLEAGCLPPPATKLVITQVLQASQAPPFWAWIIVGAFYDRHDRVIWSTEVFAAHLDIQFESDDEGSEPETDELALSNPDLPPLSSRNRILIPEPVQPTPRTKPTTKPTKPAKPASPAIQRQHRPRPTSTRQSLGIQPSAAPSLGTGKHLSALASVVGCTLGNLCASSSPVLPHAFFPRSQVSTMSGGWNPVTGRDAMGSRPSFSPYGAPNPGHGQAYIPHAGGPGYNFGTVPQYSGWPNMTYGMYPLGAQGVSMNAPYGVPAAAAAGYVPQPAAAGYYAPQAFSHQPNGAGNMLPRQPQPYPSIDTTMPAAQMTNTTGGTGCEPGYNYFFPAEHTKAHVFKTNTPPWQLPHTAQIPFKAAHIPCNTTMAELLKGFGCTNPVPKKNKCFEVVSGGGGKWYKGLEVNAADKDMMKKVIKEVGWDATRTGNPSEKPVVCLWFCKD